ncbi:MAG: alanine racemase [Leadbetterella sp.]|nr:alanine racemase [Leadbetterella sp.]
MKYEELDSPSLVIHKDRVLENIDEMIRVAGGTARLMPHIKTSKMEAVIRLMTDKGITRFKAATIAEAELAALSGAAQVLIAHQLTGPKVDRLKKLVEKYPQTTFATLADCREVAGELAGKLEKIAVYLDINNGMNRSGHEVNDDLWPFYEYVLSQKNIDVKGLHIYDGHITEADFTGREKQVSEGMKLLDGFIEKALAEKKDLELVCGGSPAFTVHVREENRTLSPGTGVFWDWGYGDS